MKRKELKEKLKELNKIQDDLNNLRLTGKHELIAWDTLESILNDISKALSNSIYEIVLIGGEWKIVKEFNY